MHKNSRRKRRGLEHALRVHAFRRYVERAAKQHGLDPKLPEIAKLIRDASFWVRQPDEGRIMRDAVDPHDGISRLNGVFVIHECFAASVLMPWTVFDYHLGSRHIEQHCSRIVVDIRGTHFYDIAGREMARDERGICNPHRLADPGNRLKNAALIANHYTNLDIDWHNLIGKRSATFTLLDGVWYAKFAD